MNDYQYAESLLPEDPGLDRVLEGIRRQAMPEISVPAGYGKLLTLLVSMTGAKSVLEIGALGGYSGICLARGLGEEGKLTSLELKPDYAELARGNMEAAGFGSLVEYRVGEALDTLEQLDREGRRFDFFFIDADKGNYLNYLEWALKLANAGAVIAGDNAFMKGKVYKPEYQGDSVKAMRKFNKAMLSDCRLEGVLLPAYDGLAIARVKKPE